MAVPPGTDQAKRNEPGIAAVTADTATNHSAPLTTERLHLWHRLLFPGPNRTNFMVGRWRDDRLGVMRVVSANSAERTIVHFEAPSPTRSMARWKRSSNGSTGTSPNLTLGRQPSPTSGS